MSPQAASSRWTVVRAVAALVGVAIALIVFLLGSGFVYNNWYNVPDITYTVLPTYEFEDLSFAGLVVENRGRATAHEVLINLGDLQTNIQQYSVDSHELWTQEGERTDPRTLVIWLDRMASGSSLTVYLLTDDEAALEHVAVTAEEGPGHLAADGPTKEETVLTIVTATLSLLMGAVSLAGALIILRFRLGPPLRSQVEAEIIAHEPDVDRLRRDRDRLQGEVEEWRSGKRFPPPPPSKADA